MHRREFVKDTAIASAALIAAPLFGKAAGTETTSLMGNRFVTFCIMIRTTPWEVSRDVKLHPRDESSWHTLDGVRSMREAFARNNQGGRLTWGFTLNALEDKRKNYAEIRAYVVQCQQKYGDEVSYFPGYFPAMYLPRERVNREMTEAIQIITNFVGNGYRPKAIMGGFLSANTLRRKNISMQRMRLFGASMPLTAAGPTVHPPILFILRASIFANRPKVRQILLTV